MVQTVYYSRRPGRGLYHRDGCPAIKRIKPTRLRSGDPLKLWVTLGLLPCELCRDAELENELDGVKGGCK